MNNGMNARTRVRSIATTFEFVSITTKYAADATTMTPVVTCERFDSLTKPLTKAAAMITTITTATPGAQPIALRGKGFGTLRPCVPRFRRNATYLRQPKRHADCGCPEAVVEPGPGLQQAGDQGTDEGAEIDAEVEEGESA